VYDFSIFSENYSNLTPYNATNEYSSITTSRSQTTIIVTTIKPETTVETTKIGTSEPEATTIQQETSMLPFSYSCKLKNLFVYHLFSIRRLTFSSKVKPNKIYVTILHVQNWTKTKQKHGGHLKQLRILKEQ
jgi:hypothetical protein